jgi:hypothetical protein
MSRPPFIFAQETERTAIDRAVRDPIKRQMLYDMVDAVLRVRESSVVSPAELGPILTGFEATDEAVWGRAAGWLAKLYGFAPELSRTLEELAGHRSAVVRFNFCASLDEFSADVAVLHLRRFLADRSARIRGTVINIAIKAGYRELIPDFKALLKKERNSAQQENLREAIALLQGKSFVRDGWRVRKLANGDLEYSG